MQKNERLAQGAHFDFNNYHTDQGNTNFSSKIDIYNL